MDYQLSQSGTRLLAADLLPQAPIADRVVDEHESARAVRLLREAAAIAHAIAARSARQYFAALRHHSPAFAAAALEHANEARLHEQRIAARIGALGGRPAQPGTAAPRIPAEPREGDTLAAVIGGYLVAGRATIESYRDIALSMETCDRETQRLLEDIVASEETRASALAGLLEETAAPAT